MTNISPETVSLLVLLSVKEVKYIELALLLLKNCLNLSHPPMPGNTVDIDGDDIDSAADFSKAIEDHSLIYGQYFGAFPYFKTEAFRIETFFLITLFLESEYDRDMIYTSVNNLASTATLNLNSVDAICMDALLQTKFTTGQLKTLLAVLVVRKSKCLKVFLERMLDYKHVCDQLTNFRIPLLFPIFCICARLLIARKILSS
jgi:hypothetical protein